MSINIAGPQAVAQETEPRQPTVRDYLIVFARGKWTLLSIFGVVLAAALIYTLLTPKTYEATSLVLVDVKGREGVPSFFDLFGTTLNTKSTNELEVLGSSSLAQTVADALLQRRHFDAEGGDIIPIIRARPDSRTNRSLADREEVAHDVRLATDFFPVKESEVIKITTKSEDPREAALIANTYAEAYTERNLTQSRSRSRAVREFLEEQLRLRKKNLEDAERTLQDYMRQSGVVTLDTEVRKVVDQLSLLEAARDALDLEMTSRRKTLAIYEQELKQQAPRAEKIVTEYNDAYIRMLQEQLARLEVQRDVTIAQNPGITTDQTYAAKLAEFNNQISTLRANLDQRTKQYLNNIVPSERGSMPGEMSASYLGGMKEKILERQIELEGIRARKTAMDGVINEYEQQFKRIPEKSVELAKRQRAHLSAEKLYLFVEEKFNEASIKEKAELGSASIVDRAVIPTTPVSPRLLFNLILGA
jgi:polysaccharide biosynthesis transport protein